MADTRPIDPDDFHDFCVADGYDAPADKVYQPNDRPGFHTHPFDARVLIIKGMLVMAMTDHEMVLGPGDVCDVPAGTPHSEQTAATGAKGLLAIRRTVA
ncbi:MAG: cupin domain-containing protein [Acidimicrobiales bacterium]|nr:cupin domain-containing protein [Acidimicrobiales bacterium]